MAMIPSFASIVHDRLADASRNRARRSAHGPATELHVITTSKLLAHGDETSGEWPPARAPRPLEPDRTRIGTLIVQIPSLTPSDAEDADERDAIRRLGSGQLSGSGGCSHAGRSSQSTRVTHLIHSGPRRPGTTSRTGAPWPARSGSPP